MSKLRNYISRHGVIFMMFIILPAHLVWGSYVYKAITAEPQSVTQGISIINGKIIQSEPVTNSKSSSKNESDMAMATFTWVLLIISLLIFKLTIFNVVAMISGAIVTKKYGEINSSEKRPNRTLIFFDLFFMKLIFIGLIISFVIEYKYLRFSEMEIYLYIFFGLVILNLVVIRPAFSGARSNMILKDLIKNGFTLSHKIQASAHMVLAFDDTKNQFAFLDGQASKVYPYESILRYGVDPVPNSNALADLRIELKDPNMPLIKMRNTYKACDMHMAKISAIIS